jgi:hypothetical protein
MILPRRCLNFEMSVDAEYVTRGRALVEIRDVLVEVETKRVEPRIYRRHPDIWNLTEAQGEVPGARGRRADFPRRNARRRHEAAVIGITEDGIVDVLARRHAGRRLDGLSERVPRSAIDLLDGIDLRRAETSRRLRPSALQGLPGLREGKGGGIELRPACRQVVDDAVDGPVEPVAGCENGAGDEVLVGYGKRRLERAAGIDLEHVVPAVAVLVDPFAHRIPRPAQ